MNPTKLDIEPASSRDKSAFPVNLREATVNSRSKDDMTSENNIYTKGGKSDTYS